MNLSLIEFSQAYTVLSNNGTMVKPYIVEQIIDKDGNTTTFETKK